MDSLMVSPSTSSHTWWIVVRNYTGAASYRTHLATCKAIRYGGQILWYMIVFLSTFSSQSGRKTKRKPHSFRILVRNPSFNLLFLLILTIFQERLVFSCLESEVEHWEEGHECFGVCDETTHKSALETAETMNGRWGRFSSCFANLPKLTKTNSKIADFHIRNSSNERKFILFVVGRVLW